MQNTRVYPRLEIRLEAEVKAGSDSDWRPALILNLSAGGALLFTEEPLPTLSVLSPLRFSIVESAGQGEPIEVEALVLRSVAGDVGHRQGYLSGLQFLNLQGEAFDLVRRFVYARWSRGDGGDG